MLCTRYAPVAGGGLSPASCVRRVVLCAGATCRGMRMNSIPSLTPSLYLGHTAKRRFLANVTARFKNPFCEFENVLRATQHLRKLVRSERIRKDRFI